MMTPDHLIAILTATSALLLCAVVVLAALLRVALTDSETRRRLGWFARVSVDEQIRKHMEGVGFTEKEEEKGGSA